MFGKKSDPTELQFEVAETAKACLTCGCIVVTKKLKKVKYLGRFGNTPDYYCNRCKPLYDEVWYCADGTIRYFQYIPKHSVEVTKGGKKIVEKKKK